MPEMRYYTVTQEREVKVRATSPIDAARIADLAFKGDGGPLPEGLEGGTTTEVRDRDILTREDY